MNNSILQNFYQRTLALYTPQAENFLNVAQPNIFKQVSFRYIFSVEAMIKISHIIEDAVIANQGVADMHVSFQHLSRLRPQKARYNEIAQSVRGLWLYGVPDRVETESIPLPRTSIVETTDTILVDYWFVVAYGPGLGMSLLAEERSAILWLFLKALIWQFISYNE